MKGYMLGIFVFFAVLATAYSIKCYVCAGEGDKCAKDNLGSSQEMTCPSSPIKLDKCMRIWGKKDDKTEIANSCSNDALCKTAKDVCDKAKDGEKCAVGCCDTDLCNAGSPVSFSVFLMTVCAALGLALLK